MVRRPSGRMQATVLPHEGRVYLDWCHTTNSWVLSHTETHERVSLPPGSWELAFDTDGFCDCVDTGDIEEPEVELDHFLRLELAQTDEGRLLIVGPEDSAGARSKLFLDTHSLQFELRNVDLKLGPTMRDHRLSAACFRRSRCGFMWFFSLVGLYVMLGFEMFGGVASRWAWQSLPTFVRRISPMVGGQVMRSQSFTKQEKQSDMGDRCLPWHSVSSLGLVVLLSGWCSSTSRTGGLQIERHRLASQELLRSVVRLACGDSARQVPLLLDDAFEWRWPRPAGGEHRFALIVKAANH